MENNDLNIEQNYETLEDNSIRQTEIEEKLPKRSLKFEDGTIVNNLKVTYKNLFDFQNSYDGSKDLMEVLIKKQALDYETMIQIIYVGYLGTNPDPKLEYFDFIDRLAIDYKRDMQLFTELTGIKTDKKN